MFSTAPHRARLPRIGLAALAATTLAFGAIAATPAAPSKRGAPARVSKPAVLPFIHDDYAAARERARAAKLPLFIESWAPW